MKHLKVLTILLLTANLSLFGQIKTREDNSSSGDGLTKSDNKTYGDDWESRSWKEKIVFGGNIGSIAFGNPTSIDVSPLVGYRFTEKFTAGVGVGYTYYRFRGFDALQIYSGRIFTQYQLHRNFSAYVELEGINFPYYDKIKGEDLRYTGIYPFVGGIYRQPIGGRLYFQIMALYNLKYSSDYAQGKPLLYSSPLQFRMGIISW